ncbi:helix-turn-helix domain-containing protein [Streptococcus lutetiensis]|uniref:helix-turn-helix domain-containing protein n=1 Tax=Streptococcus lutetiensis TaxID=150055 RepID=UPI001BDA6235|nr:helix-turn-helix transcriptional regulator [Streptococcus lutetiensis]MBT0902554.1 helix-turn-helix domain-containing protein [Streptococcus lutetiensis]MBT0923593.1 helix-turn-helix domain-containing protein [Streptococcus lutetiensis]
MNKLKELRKATGFTQKSFSKEVGIPLRTLQNWENGESNIKPEKAKLLADYFNVQIPYLLGYSEIRYGSEQITKAIKESISRKNEQLNYEQLENTLKICELASFLNMDLGAIVELYNYNSSSDSPVESLEDLSDFFLARFRDCNEVLYDISPTPDAGIEAVAAEYEEYLEKLQDYLAKRKFGDNYQSAVSSDEPFVIDYSILDNIKNIGNVEELDELITDTLLANRLLDRLKDKMIKSNIVGKDYNLEIEKVMSWLIDFNNALDKRKKTIENKHTPTDND